MKKRQLFLEGDTGAVESVLVEYGDGRSAAVTFWTRGGHLCTFAVAEPEAEAIARRLANRPTSTLK